MMILRMISGLDKGRESIDCCLGLGEALYSRDTDNESGQIPGSVEQNKRKIPGRVQD